MNGRNKEGIVFSDEVINICVLILSHSTQGARCFSLS